MALTTTFVNIKNDFPTSLHRAQGYIKGTYTAASVTSATSPSATAAGGGIANGAAVVDTTIASGVMTIRLGFVPLYVKVVNVTDRITQEYFDGMNAGDFVETAANGTRTLETDDKLTVTITGGSAGSSGGGGTAPASSTGVVTITADGGAFTDNDTMTWVAEG